MTFFDLYKDLVKSHLLQEKLKETELPTITELEQEFNDLNSNIADQTLITNKLDIASASQINEIVSNIYKDINISDEILKYITSSLTNTFTKSLLRLEAYDRTILDNIRSFRDKFFSIDGFSQFFDCIGDNFSTALYIDMENSSIQHDVAGKTIAIGQSELVTNTPTSLNLENATLSFKPGTSKGFLNSSSLPGLALSNLKSNRGAWKHQISYANLNDYIECELAITLEEAYTINEIILESPVASSNNLWGKLFLSEDSQSWTGPINGKWRDISVTSSWNFQPKDVKYLRFQFRIFSPAFTDTKGGRIYTVGCDNIKILHSSYAAYESTLLSTDFISNDPFYNCSLEICETLPTNTSIDYYIAFGETDTETVWIKNPDDTIKYSRIAPLGTEDKTLPAVIHPFSLQTKVSPGLRVIKGDPLTGITKTTEVSSTKLYRLNTTLQTSSIENRTIVLRNTRELKTPPYIIVGPHGKAAPKGWWFDGTYYHCWINISTPEGFTVDMGKVPIYIDNIEYVNRVKLTRGLHKIDVHFSAWYDPYLGPFSEDGFVGSPVSPITAMNKFKNSPPTLIDQSGTEAIDLLYPYNQKLLIEGVNLATSFRDITFPYPNAKYILTAAYNLKKSNLFDMESPNVNSKELYNTFAIVDFATGSATKKTVIVMPLSTTTNIDPSSTLTNTDNVTEGEAFAVIETKPQTFFCRELSYIDATETIEMLYGLQ